MLSIYLPTYLPEGNEQPAGGGVGLQPLDGAAPPHILRLAPRRLDEENDDDDSGGD